jgi:hypothetical protein
VGELHQEHLDFDLSVPALISSVLHGAARWSPVTSTEKFLDAIDDFLAGARPVLRSARTTEVATDDRETRLVSARPARHHRGDRIRKCTGYSALE